VQPYNLTEPYHRQHRYQVTIMPQATIVNPSHHREHSVVVTGARIPVNPLKTIRLRILIPAHVLRLSSVRAASLTEPPRVARLDAHLDSGACASPLFGPDGVVNGAAARCTT
jgi:hypothetical protein